MHQQVPTPTGTGGVVSRHRLVRATAPGWAPPRGRPTRRCSGGSTCVRHGCGIHSRPPLGGRRPRSAECPLICPPFKFRPLPSALPSSSGPSHRRLTPPHANNPACAGWRVPAYPHAFNPSHANAPGGGWRVAGGGWLQHHAHTGWLHHHAHAAVGCPSGGLPIEPLILRVSPRPRVVPAAAACRAACASALSAWWQDSGRPHVCDITPGSPAHPHQSQAAVSQPTPTPTHSKNVRAWQGRQGPRQGRC